MGKNLVIVESPAKAKTLKKFLGANYKIAASVGHVRDLPKSDLGIDIENDFEPRYITIRGKGEVLSNLRKEVKTADKVYLATDPDREGEAISWHLFHALKLDMLNEDKVKRITFNEITKKAVKDSIKEAREINMKLVDAQQARRSLDRIVGYKISPLLWKKVKKGLSAGRVQSVSLKMICDREDEINAFNPEEYWTITAKLKPEKGKTKEVIEAKYHSSEIDGKIVKDLKNKEQVELILKDIENKQMLVEQIKKGSRVKQAVAPFTTSVLQQTASNLLGFATYKTMSVAQQLYEGVDVAGEGTVGLISYIRTDSFRISDDSYEQVKEYITNKYGNEYLNPKRPVYKNRGKSQDAHEAIRPTDVTRHPDEMKESLSRDQYRLYKLIWERFVSSQMSSAVYETMTIKLKCGNHNFRSSGSLMKFDGYLLIYRKNEENEADVQFPELVEGQMLQQIEIDPAQHFTSPPPRYTEAALVKTMEELGIGRPSTYSAIITTLTTRNYITKENKVFYSTELGGIVNEIMKSNFNEIVDSEFTAKMEERLDQVEEGEYEWKAVLRNFYPEFKEKLEKAEEAIGDVELTYEESDVICEHCGKNLVIKFGRFGKFLACPGFPDCRNSKPYFEKLEDVKCPKCETGDVLIKKSKKGRLFYGCSNIECDFITWNRPTGEKCPECGDYIVEKGKGKTACQNSKCSYVAKEKD